MHFAKSIRLTRHDNLGRYWSSCADAPLQVLLKNPQLLAGMTAIGHYLALAIDRSLILSSGLRVLETYALEQPVRRLFAGEADRKQGVVIAHHVGFSLHWLGTDQPLYVDNELINPVATFTRESRLVVAGENRGQIYEFDGESPFATSVFEWTGPPPVALIPADAPTQFAALDTDGRVTIWQIP
jgi:hypothetical protein